LQFELLEGRTMLAGHGDFNGDGRDDLAVGVPFESVGSVSGAGAVSVIYGSRRGLNAAGNQFWHENVSGIDGVASDGDNFGYALAIGDFNGDGFDDLAISAPNKSVNGQAQAGVVHVIYGSAVGLTAKNDQLWSQDSPGINDAAEAVDVFGFALAAGDFNGDGRDDLAVGVEAEDVGDVVDAGMINVLYGSASGLSNSNDQNWHQNSSGINDHAETSEVFGFALTVGDFDGDGRDDLAVGVPGEDVETVVDAGAANVIYGASGGLTGAADQLWHQNVTGVAEEAETGDQFGYSLTAGDFNGDGRDDLAVGAPGEDIDYSTGVIPEFAVDAGIVNLFYGSAGKLTSGGGNPKTDLRENGWDRLQAAFARYGYALAAGDFDGDGVDDLAIGAPNQDSNQGFVHINVGDSVVGLDSELQYWNQDHETFPTAAEADDLFGYALTAGDYNGDGYSDVAIGVPGEDVASGFVHVLYGFFIGPVDAAAQFWYQPILNSNDISEPNDRFGFSLG
jgi:hypothetical protein